jgi:hypothetical protein
MVLKKIVNRHAIPRSFFVHERCPDFYALKGRRNSLQIEKTTWPLHKKDGRFPMETERQEALKFQLPVTSISVDCSTLSPDKYVPLICLARED